MRLRHSRNERHQTPKKFRNFRSLNLYVEWVGPIERYRARGRCELKGRVLLSSRIQAQSRLRDVVQNVMAITDAPSRFWQRQGVMRRPFRAQSEGGPHEYHASPWISRRSDGTIRYSARYNRLFADGVLRIARLGEPSHRQSLKRARGDKAHRFDAMTSSRRVPDPIALRATRKGNLLMLLVVAVVVLAVAS